MGGATALTTVLYANGPGSSIWEVTALSWASVFLSSAFCTEPTMQLALSKYAVGQIKCERVCSHVHQYKSRGALLRSRK